MKIVYLGSSELSVIPLKRLMEAGYEILAVVCQPDRPNKRGNKIEISDLKEYAVVNNIPVYQFDKIREEGIDILKALNPDLLVVVYYGQILSQEIIDIGKFGSINVHPSLLPKYRGPSPVITSILNGDKETGVTIMRIEKKVDSGRILAQEKTKILESETAGELWERLTTLGSDLIIKVIQKINTIEEIEQQHSQATFTKMFDKKDAEIDFNKSSEEVVNHIRAFNPNPVAYFMYKEEKFKVYEAKIVKDSLKMNKENGTILTSSTKEGLQIKVEQGAVYIKQIQSPNGKKMDIKNFLNGKSFDVGYLIKKFGKK